MMRDKICLRKKMVGRNGYYEGHQCKAYGILPVRKKKKGNTPLTHFIGKGNQDGVNINGSPD